MKVWGDLRRDRRVCTVRMMKLDSGGMQGKYPEDRRLFICTPPLRALAFEGQASHSFPRKATCRPRRDGVPQEYASLPTKASSSHTSSTTPSKHPAINHNCPPRPHIFILFPRMALRRVPDI